MLWQCQPGACAFCQQNDGAVVEAGEAFPNGAMTPADCHRFCRCSAYELAIPADGSVSADDLDGADSDNLIALYAIGYLASRHDRDVAAQQEAEAAQTGLSADDLFEDTSDATDDDEDANAGGHDITPVVLPPPVATPKPRPRRRRRH